MRHSALCIIPALAAALAQTPPVPGRATPGPAGGFESTLDNLERRLRMPNLSQAERMRDLEIFNNGFQREFNSTWNARPVNQRPLLLQRSYGFLNGLRGYGIRDLAFGLALSNAYRNLGGFQQGIADPGLRGMYGGPLLGYRSSALILDQLATDNPNDPTVRGQLLMDVNRMNSLGLPLPIFMSVPIGGQRPQEERGIPSQYTQPPAEIATQPLPPLPSVDLNSIPAAERAEAQEILDRYQGTLVTAKRALEALAPFQANNTIAPATVQSLNRMRGHIENASKDIELRAWANARDSLMIAGGEARKALKTVGR